MDLQLNIFEESIFERLTELFTDKAKLVVDKIEYNKSEKKLKLLILRYPVHFISKGLFRNKIITVYDKSKRIKTEIIICNISLFSSEIEKGIKEATILFGIKIDHNNIYLSSAEENKTGPICQVKIETSELSMKIRDIKDL